MIGPRENAASYDPKSSMVLSEARREAWVRGSGQVSDDVCWQQQRSRSGDCKVSRLGPRSPHKEKTMAKKREKRECKAVVLEPDAAGIDIGAEEIYVAVPPDRDEESVRRFSSFTCDLHALADWLEQCQIRTVAMESTGVYWIPLFQILEARGLEVFLVNAHYLKSVPGRKSDVSDCQWIQYLHSVGLLRASFRPTLDICAVRSLWRHRTSLLQMASEHILHMQKARGQLYRIAGVDLTDIPGVSAVTAQVILTEIGPDLRRFRHASAFASWLGL